ncbi:MAG: hypothetical protein A2119_02420 [Candidatus Colwellbacteria bacterium GWA2_46_10]|nr:MAG: hypothetical protein A2119_02420 [Candidatus Colwellbacteria bacterium GWA2_46_10]
MQNINVGKYEKLLRRRGLEPADLPIREPHKKTRLYLDNEYFKKGYASKFSKCATMVYAALAMHANHRYQTCFPSIETLMKFTGIRNRNSINNAIKILEAFNIVLVEHSKGRISNSYTLLRPDVWKPINSIDIDTVIKSRKTVSKSNGQQYQKDSSNSITGDTRSHITKSYKRNQGF